MIIEIISPETISLMGNPDNLEEKAFPSIKDKALGYISELDVEYGDLVFTLKHNPKKYNCPFIRFEENKLVVVAHNIFFNAGKEVGLNKMNFNLVKSQDLPLEQLMQEYNLEFSPPAIQREYMESFVFYKNPINEVKSKSPIVLMNPLNDTEEFKEIHCIAYKIFVGNTDELIKAEHQLMEEQYNHSNKIRSIGGFREAPSEINKYF